MSFCSSWVEGSGDIKRASLAVATGLLTVASRVAGSRFVRQPLLLCSLLAIVGAAPSFADDDRRDRPPNIVFILADDLGYPYAGFMGDEIVETPNLDRLAAEGTTFTHAFSPESVCRPAMQTLLSGLHPRSWAAQRSRLASAIGEPIPTRTEVQYYVTLPRQLARQGYRSFQGGKLWEGDFAIAGFDAGTTVALSGVPFSSPDWFTFARPSLSPLHDFLDGIEEDEPFFLFLAPMLPHTPHDPPARLLLRYWLKGLSPAAVYYYANITRFDEVVGRIVATLEERGLRDDSLIVYVSDNGWEQGPYDPPYYLGNVLGGNRGKLSNYELGVRSPLIFNWPGRVPENVVRDDLVTFDDLHATLLAYGGAPMPPDHKGNSLIPQIEGWGEPARDHVTGIQDIFRQEEGPVIFPWIFVRDTAGFVRTDRWRYVEWLKRGEQALYHIEEDPFEQNDVGGAYPEMLAHFAERAAAWRDGLTQPAAWMDLMGRLTAEDGTPAAGLRLWLEGADESGSPAQFEVFSNDRGFFRFPNVPAGEFTLRYEIGVPATVGRWWRPRSSRETRSAEINLVGYQTSPFLSIQIPGDAPPTPPKQRRFGTIEIELRNRAGNEISGLPVLVRGWTSLGYVKQRVLTGPDGFVAVDQLPPGFYAIRVSAPRGVRSKLNWVYLRPGATELLEMKLLGKRPRHVRTARPARAVPGS